MAGLQRGLKDDVMLHRYAGLPRDIMFAQSHRGGEDFQDFIQVTLKDDSDIGQAEGTSTIL